jgi:F-type H+-transporting ATPase subunit alpha
LTEILKQDQYKPLPMEKQVLIIFAATHGYLDGYAVSECRQYEQMLYEFVENQHPSLLREIAEKKDIKGELTDKLKAALAEFSSAFRPSAKG